MQFYRLRKDVVVAPESVVSIAINDIPSSEEIVVCISDDSIYRVAKRRYPDQYKSLKAYVESVPTLAELLDPTNARRRQIVGDAFDPFIDDRFTAIYSLFQQIPTHEQLLLCIETDEVGSVQRKDNRQVVVIWENCKQAIDRITAYRQQVEEAVSVDATDVDLL